MIVKEAARKAPCRVHAVHSDLDGQNSADRRLKHHYSCVVRVKTRQSFSKEEIFQVPSEQPQFPPTFESFSLSWKKRQNSKKDPSFSSLLCSLAHGIHPQIFWGIIRADFISWGKENSPEQLRNLPAVMWVEGELECKRFPGSVCFCH